MRHLFHQTSMTCFSAHSREIILGCLGGAFLAYFLFFFFDVTAHPPSEGSGSTASPNSQQKISAPPDGNIAPIRVIHDRYPNVAAVAVDSVSDQVVVSDDNLFSLLVYDRTVPGDSNRPTEYRRKITGEKSGVRRACGVAMDPVRKEIYMVNNDAGNNMLVFPYMQGGDVPPIRDLRVDHGVWGISLDREHGEVAMTIEHLNKISVYRQTAQGEEATVRFIQGPKTELADPHGIFVDTRNDEIVVTNHHSLHEVETGVHAATLNFRYMLQSTGRFVEPSIAFYSRTAEGNVAPLRKIRGSRTRLALPMGVFVDTEQDLIAVANDQTHSILFFSRTAQGNVAPLYTLEGPATGLKNPVWVHIDTKNNEIWVANAGDHSVTVYARNARGNAAPLRSIRTAPKGEPWAGLGSPSGVAYDPGRDQILVPN
ncbi:hypothetical protein MYX82_00970 [Acidobacteria bacterium AH-259-D05]|nr:hypothetical protein [Acidobacteria bacterium AH-259-D05]